MTAYAHILSDDEKRELLRIARTAVAEWCITGGLPPGKPHKESLLKLGGAFVSLHRGKALRGCIGTTGATSPIYRVVQNMAVAAATRDPRFGPVTSEELDSLEFEVSVLGELEAISGPDDVEVGTHGLSIDVGAARGLLLPQVASSRAWTSEEFLAQVCAKAGLPEDAWSSPDAQVTRFAAQVFSERDFPPIDPMSLLD